MSSFHRRNVNWHQEECENTMTNFSDIIEENGNTVRENNMEKEHKIPIGTLVEVRYEQQFLGGASESVHARLWVVGHDRDCDGEPLYTLCHLKEPSQGTVIIAGYVLNGNVSRSIINNFHTGFSEKQLTPVDLTEETISKDME